MSVILSIFLKYEEKKKYAVKILSWIRQNHSSSFEYELCFHKKYKTLYSKGSHQNNVSVTSGWVQKFKMERVLL